RKPFWIFQTLCLMRENRVCCQWHFIRNIKAMVFSLCTTQIMMATSPLRVTRFHQIRTLQIQQQIRSHLYWSFRRITKITTVAIYNFAHKEVLTTCILPRVMGVVVMIRIIMPKTRRLYWERCYAWMWTHRAPVLKCGRWVFAIHFDGASTGAPVISGLVTWARVHVKK